MHFTRSGVISRCDLKKFSLAFSSAFVVDSRKVLTLEALVSWHDDVSNVSNPACTKYDALLRDRHDGAGHISKRCGNVIVIRLVVL